MSLVIIGTGLAGYNLAREWRKLNPDAPLVILTRDDGRNYSKPMLSTGYTKGQSADDLAQSDAGQMAGQLKASVWTMTKVNEIDTARQAAQAQLREIEGLPQRLLARAFAPHGD